MELLIIWVLLAVACGYVAEQKGRSYIAWFALGLLFGVFALLVLAITPKKE